VRLKQLQGAQQWLVYAGLGCYMPGFAAKEIDNLSDMLDPEICSDDDLVSAPIFMSRSDAAHFRSLVNACTTASSEGGVDGEAYAIKGTDEKYLKYHAKGPTTQEFTHYDIVVMQWCLEAYELFRKTPTSFIIHALRDAESRHLAKIGGETDVSDLSSAAPDSDRQSNELEARSSSPSYLKNNNNENGKDENGGSCLGRFCIEVSVGEVVPQLCKASAHGNSSSSHAAEATRGRSGSVLTSDSTSLIERALDIASLGVLTKDSCGTLQYLGREISNMHKPRFLCLDCRPSAHVARWGKFATTFTLDTPLDTISHVRDICFSDSLLFCSHLPEKKKRECVIKKNL
jgi:hypothetical protein